MRDVTHDLFFNHGFKFQDSLCNGCHDFSMFYLNISDITIITVKNIDYLCISLFKTVYFTFLVYYI